MGQLENTVILKSLETQRNKLQAQRKQLNKEISDKQHESSIMKQRITKLQKQIEILKEKKSKEIIISEHAFLRYIERVLGINMDSISKKLLPKEHINFIKAVGNGSYKLDSHSVVIKDNVVVTVTI